MQNPHVSITSKQDDGEFVWHETKPKRENIRKIQNLKKDIDP